MNITCLLKGHQWNGCTCVRCGEVRDEGHDVTGNTADGCTGTCRICGRMIDHDWEAVSSYTAEEDTYDSAGRPASDITETVYRCRRCGKEKTVRTGY